MREPDTFKSTTMCVYRKPKPNAEVATPADGGEQITVDGKDDGRRAEVATKVGGDSGRGAASVAGPAAVVSAERVEGPAAVASAARDSGPTIVAVIPDDDPAAGNDVEPRPRRTASDDRGGPPTVAATATRGGAGAGKASVGRSTSTEGGKSSTGPSKTVGGGGGGGRAIVEILDRVDTPPQPSSVTVAADDGGGRIDDDGGGDEPVAFSVLPNRGQDDAPLPCECPDCVKKPKTKRSSTSKSSFVMYILHGRILRFIRFWPPARKTMSGTKDMT